VGQNYFLRQQKQKLLQKELHENIDISCCVSVVGAANAGKSVLIQTETSDFGTIGLSHS
jgi:AICAR transformylase/IMP cyclohydrolase PurH